MTGYELSRAFFDWTWDNPEHRSTNMTALYMWFIEKWNRCGQPQKFSVTASESMYCLGMKSRNTYSETFNKLVEHGFIKIVVKSTNQHNCNVIMLTQNISKQKDSKRTALDKALIQQVSKQEDSIDTINKQVNKETSKQRNKETKDFPDLKKSVHPSYGFIKDCFLKFHLEKNKHDYYFEAKDGEKINRIIKKLEFKIKEKHPILLQNEIPEQINIGFDYMIKNIKDEWILQNISLSLIDSKFNEIISKIINPSQNGKQSVTDKNRQAATNVLADIAKRRL